LYSKCIATHPSFLTETKKPVCLSNLLCATKTENKNPASTAFCGEVHYDKKGLYSLYIAGEESRVVNRRTEGIFYIFSFLCDPYESLRVVDVHIHNSIVHKCLHQSFM